MPDIGLIKGEIPGGLSPDSGEEIIGEDEAPYALPVEHNGPITTRQLPHRHGVATNFQIPAGQAIQALNPDPRRARVVLTCALGIASYGTNSAAVKSGRGFIFPVGSSITLLNSEQIWLGNPHATDTCTVSVLAENWAD